MRVLGFSRRRLVVGVTVVAASVAGATLVIGSGANADDPIKIGVAQHSLAEQFQATENKLILKQADALGVSIMAINANLKPDAQFNAMTQMVNAGVKAIIVNPIDAKAIIPGIDYASKHGVPVVTVDGGSDGGDVYMAVRADNTAMAGNACEAVAKQLGGKGEVLMLSGDLANSVGLERAKGFTDCITAKYPGITVYAQAANWQPPKAGAAAQTLLTAHPDIKAIYMATDTLYLAPAWSALQRLNMAHLVGEAGHIFMVSIDGSPAGLDGIRDGRMDLVISQPLNKYAEFAVKYALAGAKGEKQAVGNGISGPIAEVNGQLTAFIPADLVTKANVENPDLWGNGK